MSCVVTKLVPVTCPTPLTPGQRSIAPVERTFNPSGNPDNGAGPDGRIGAIPYCGTEGYEIETYRAWWDEMIRQYGLRIDYYANTVKIDSQSSMLYGENPTKAYQKPKRIIGMVEMNPESSILSRFGIDITSEAKIVISFNEFRHYFGDTAYPKAGDLVVLADAYCDRPPGFGVKIYEITSKVDEVIGETNFQGRHYVWTLDAVRYQHSYEPGAPTETAVLPIASESANVGSSTAPAEKTYTQTADQFAAENFDQSTRGSKDFVYGRY